jgi:putative colanic acid biosynthesis UDP-glucose lipid carrier transferase
MIAGLGKDNALKGCIMALDIILLVCVVLGTYIVEYYFFRSKIAHIDNMPALLAIYIFSFLASYSIYPAIVQKRIVKIEDIAKRVTTTSLLMFLFVSLLTLLTKLNPIFPRTFLLATFFIFTPLLFLERLLIRKTLTSVRSNKKNQKNILLIGGESEVYELYKTLKNPAYGYNIIGVFYDGEPTADDFKKIRVGGLGDIYEWLATHNNVNEIYGYIPKENQDLINIVSKFCDNHLIRFFYIPALDVFGSKMSLSFVGNTPVIAKREEPLAKPTNKFIKRAFDLICSSLVLIFIFPWLYIFVAIMIKIKSPGPVFFKQERTGLDGKIFLCYKFRTMKVNKDADKIQATKDDPRKYPFGDFMRKTNIDEIPQFINVWKGEMSMVGPRPHMLLHTEEYSKLINRFMVRHLAKPGITGLAQVTGFRGETKYIDQMEGRVKKDIEYIENWTFFLDIKIMIKTITNMFGGEKNAY